MMLISMKDHPARPLQILYPTNVVEQPSHQVYCLPVILQCRPLVVDHTLSVVFSQKKNVL